MPDIKHEINGTVEALKENSKEWTN